MKTLDRTKAESILSIVEGELSSHYGCPTSDCTLLSDLEDTLSGMWVEEVEEPELPALEGVSFA